MDRNYFPATDKTIADVQAANDAQWGDQREFYVGAQAKTPSPDTPETKAAMKEKGGFTTKKKKEGPVHKEFYVGAQAKTPSPDTPETKAAMKKVGGFTTRTPPR